MTPPMKYAIAFVTLYAIFWYVKNFPAVTLQVHVSHFRFTEMLCIWHEALTRNAVAYTHHTWATHEAGEYPPALSMHCGFNNLCHSL
jgi:hypothetical protein